MGAERLFKIQYYVNIDKYKDLGTNRDREQKRTIIHTIANTTILDNNNAKVIIV